MIHWAKTTSAKLLHKLKEEHGANQILALYVMMLALLVIPVILDLAIVESSRRVSQVGSDSATLAASKDYAWALSTTFVGFCNEPSSSVVARYKATQVIPIGWSPLGAASAGQYAGQNQTRLTRYYNNLIYRGSKTVAGVRIPNVQVYTGTDKEIDPLINYGRLFQAPAEATSVAYLDRWDHYVYSCGWFGSYHVYRFYWKISLTN